MKIESIPVFNNKALNVIVETPSGSHYKYAYDPEKELMKIKYELPVGYYFPVNFGFVPQTLAEDGDPLDALVFSDESLVSGCLIETRIIGVLKARQNKDGRIVRNDRILVVPTGLSFDQIKTLNDINKSILGQLENFFISYNKYRKVNLEILQREGPVQAQKIILDAVKKYKKANAGD
jgi:inorganic pyrophosphatase